MLARWEDSLGVAALGCHLPEADASLIGNLVILGHQRGLEDFDKRGRVTAQVDSERFQYEIQNCVGGGGTNVWMVENFSKYPRVTRWLRDVYMLQTYNFNTILVYFNTESRQTISPNKYVLKPAVCWWTESNFNSKLTWKILNKANIVLPILWL